MKRFLTSPLRRRAQRGSAAVEVAIVIGVLFWLILGTFVVGRLIWQYNVVKTATANAARYLAVAPWTQARQDHAAAIIVDAAQGAGLTGVVPQFYCSAFGCANDKSTYISVAATLPYDDPTHYLVGDGMGVLGQSVVRNPH